MFCPLPDTQEQFEISLPELLDSRDARLARQQAWIGLHQVSFFQELSKTTLLLDMCLIRA